MKLQQMQLQELASWLTKAETVIEETGPIGSDLDTVKSQVDQHKAFQDDLEDQQIHVNSLSHMVVVVDESESENATADLEEQLALLGERWSAVCKWTGNRLVKYTNLKLIISLYLWWSIEILLLVNFAGKSTSTSNRSQNFVRKIDENNIYILSSFL